MWTVFAFCCPSQSFTGRIWDVISCLGLLLVALQAACWLFLFCFEILHWRTKLRYIQGGSHSGLVGKALSVNFYFINFIVFHIIVHLLANGHISQNRPKLDLNKRGVRLQFVKAEKTEGTLWCLCRRKRWFESHAWVESDLLYCQCSSWLMKDFWEHTAEKAEIQGS